MNHGMGETQAFDPAAYPALRDFLPGYLHQDFRDEFGSAMGAVKVFLSEASGDEILQVKEEWQLLRNAFLGRPLKDLQDALRKLGSGWMPEHEMEVQGVDKMLSGAEA